jgi:cystathionine beta-lyase family protein involved in aluminum resistance
LFISKNVIFLVDNVYGEAVEAVKSRPLYQLLPPR